MENGTAAKQQQFLVDWSVLNLLGWIIGFFLVFIMAHNLESIKHLAWVYGLATDFRKEWTGETALVWFPMGLSVGILQWSKLKQFGINLFVWAFVTTLGSTILVTLFSWVNNFGSFENQRTYDIPFWLINLGLAIALPLGGAVVGGLQSIAIRRHISSSGLWIRAYVIGFLLPSLVTPLTFLVKSFLLNILYSFEFLYIFVAMRWFLLFGFLFIITVLSISILTGKILLKQPNAEFTTIQAPNTPRS